MLKANKLKTLQVLIVSFALVLAYMPVPINALDTPGWWDGDCDVNKNIGSYALGASFNGVKACGGGTSMRVYFFPGAWGEDEWECIELSMRYMYLAYGIAPYSANGKDTVWNYSGSRLTKISNNGTSLPTPGDVLSHDYGDQFGHTSVVTSTSVNSSGNGTITVMEQNHSSSVNGSRSINVTSMMVGDNVTGWLHDPLYTNQSALDPDFNMDGSTDIAWHQGSTLFMFGGKTDGSLANVGNTTGIGTPDWSGSGDTDMDGRSEVFWHQGSSIYTLAWNGSSWVVRNTTNGIGTPDAAVTGDFNLDGRTDIAWHQGTTLFLLVGQANGSFAIAGNSTGIGTPDWSGSGDTDMDGRSEVFWHQGSNLYNLVWLGSSWGLRYTTSNIGTPDAAATGDFNLDGRTDIAWHQGTTLFLLAGYNNGSFGNAGNSINIGTPSWSGSGDTDKDGRSEVFWYQGTTIYTFVWNGSSWAVRSTTNNIGSPDAATASK